MFLRCGFLHSFILNELLPAYVPVELFYLGCSAQTFSFLLIEYLGLLWGWMEQMEDAG